MVPEYADTQKRLDAATELLMEAGSWSDQAAVNEAFNHYNKAVIAHQDAHPELNCYGYPNTTAGQQPRAD